MPGLAVLLAALALSEPAAAPPPSTGTAEWTLMVYVDADCDLEEPTLRDLEEMLAAGSTPQVNVVALVDRAAKGEEEDGYSNRAVANLPNWTTAKLLYVEQGKLRELADWGEANLSDGATLRRFVETVRQAYPARRYGLVIGDHGAAWPGVAADDTAAQEADLLTPDELRKALEPALAGTPLDLIGFDACLMANLETAQTLAPVARTLVASEELEPGMGWEYTTPLRALARQPSLGGQELGRLIADAFRDSYEKSPHEEMREQAPGTTLAVVALDRLSGLDTAVAGLAEQLKKGLEKGGRGAWLQVAESRARTEQYGTLGDPQESATSLYDLRDLARKLAQNVGDPAVKAAAGAVEAAVGQVVVHAVRGRARPDSSGLSVFFPRDGETLAAREPSAYGDLQAVRAGRWLPFLQAYVGQSDADHDDPDVEEEQASAHEVSAEHPVHVSAKVKADDVEEAYFVLQEAHESDSYVVGQVLVEPDEHGLLEDEWDGDWFTIGNGKQHLVCPITDMEPVGDDEQEHDVEGLYYVEVPVQAARKGSSRWYDVWLYFLVDFEADEVKGDFVYGFLDTADGPREFELRAGDRVRPVYLHIDEQGEEDHVVSEDPADEIVLARGAEDLEVGMERVAPGEYQVGFVVWDYAGNVTEKLSDVTVR